MKEYRIYFKSNAEDKAEYPTEIVLLADDDTEALRRYCHLDRARRDNEFMSLVLGMSPYRVGQAVLGYHNKKGFVYALENN